jgi:hypothetical protein
MYCTRYDRYTAKHQFDVLPCKFVVVTGDISDMRPFPRLAQHFLNNVIVRLRPVPGTAQLPAVDNVTDKVQIFLFVATKKIEEKVGLAAFGAKMCVRNPYRAVAVGSFHIELCANQYALEASILM